MMQQQKNKWTTIGLPTILVQRVRRTIKKTGHMSVSEYARFAINERIKFDEESLREEVLKDEY